jgi:hypothetical protein
LQTKPQSDEKTASHKGFDGGTTGTIPPGLKKPNLACFENDTGTGTGISAILKWFKIRQKF